MGRQENNAGKHSIKVRDIAERHGIPYCTTSIDDALAGAGGGGSYFDAQVTSARFDAELALRSSAEGRRIEVPGSLTGGDA